MEVIVQIGSVALELQSNEGRSDETVGRSFALAFRRTEPWVFHVRWGVARRERFAKTNSMITETGVPYLLRGVPLPERGNGVCDEAGGRGAVVRASGLGCTHCRISPAGQCIKLSHHEFVPSALDCWR